jgi:hypothetical protein
MVRAWIVTETASDVLVPRPEGQHRRHPMVVDLIADSTVNLKVGSWVQVLVELSGPIGQVWCLDLGRRKIDMSS